VLVHVARSAKYFDITVYVVERVAVDVMAILAGVYTAHANTNSKTPRAPRPSNFF